MHCVMWTYAVPPQLTERAIRELFDDVAANYLEVPGLIRKYFGFSEDATLVVGIYLWASKEDADRFYSPEWTAGVTERWGATPKRDDWVVPVVAETTAGTVMREPTTSAALLKSVAGSDSAAILPGHGEPGPTETKPFRPAS